MKAVVVKLGVLALVAVGLTACTEDQAAPDPDVSQTVTVSKLSDSIHPVKVGTIGQAEVYKFCDSGNLLYVIDGYRESGIAVKPNAEECKK